MPAPSKSIWVPPTYQYRELAEARRAVKDYDPDLDFGKNEETGQWCVFLKQGTTELTRERPLPVLGFNHIPGRDEVQKRLYQTDAVRRGREIFASMERHNQDIYDDIEKKAKEADGDVAEHFEWGMRKMGHDKAPVKVFMPGDK